MRGQAVADQEGRTRRVGQLVAAEPVRMYVYAVLAALAAVLVGRGVMTGDAALLYLALLAAVLGIPATEHARSLVSPVQYERDRRRRGRHQV